MTDLVKCPFTGNMIPRPSRKVRVDIIEAGPLPAEVARSEAERVSSELAGIRLEWVQVGPGRRSGATGDKLMKRYRKLALEYWHLTGNHPPQIHADM